MNRTRVSSYDGKTPHKLVKNIHTPLSWLFFCEGNCVAFYVVSLKCDQEKEIRTVRQNEIFEIKYII